MTRPVRLVPLAALLGAALALTACAGVPVTSGVPATPGAAAAPGVAAAAGASRAAPAPTVHAAVAVHRARGAAAGPTKVLVVVEENKDRGRALRGMPALARLARRYGTATAYQAVAHPSLPNYLAIVGGSTFGVHDDAYPSRHRLRGTTVLDRALASGHTARAYLEAMPRPCGLASTRRYAVKHNPWAYFADRGPRAACRAHSVASGTPPAGALHDDAVAGTLPDVGYLVPDICHDAHDCSLAVADRWLRDWMRVLMAGPDFRSGRLAVVVTFDEDDGGHGNGVACVVVHPRLQGTVVRRRLTHYSLTRWLAEVSGSPAPGAAARAPSLRAAFGL